MKRLTFASGAAMLSYLSDGKDLYNTETGEYVFSYNTFGSIAVYNLTEHEAEELARQAADADEYWGAFLGFGGQIYDDISYPLHDDMSYSLRSPYGRTNIEYCDEKFRSYDWAAADRSYLDKYIVVVPDARAGNPVGRIDYLWCDGTVRERFEYMDAEHLKKDIEEENYYGEPMSVVIYRDAEGNTVPHDYIFRCDPPLQGFSIAEII